MPQPTVYNLVQKILVHYLIRSMLQFQGASTSCSSKKTEVEFHREILSTTTLACARIPWLPAPARRIHRNSVKSLKFPSIPLRTLGRKSVPNSGTPTVKQYRSIGRRCRPLALHSYQPSTMDKTTTGYLQEKGKAQGCLTNYIN